ncbi:MAG TPA: serine/threonine-protein kinase [Pyrinomonadaceae bacterium]|nr:serine/threonine-protein kinase [Pyrinomonadaceae bacterium]
MNENNFQDEDPILPEPNSGSNRKTEPIPKNDMIEGHTLDGRFLIIRNLTENDAADKGGIGLVYLAQDLKLLGKQVVIKILQETSLQNDDITRKFKHEREALTRLDHPNIVRILDSGLLNSGNPYMVMEYIQGYSLRRVINENKKISFEFCAHIIESITNALSATHLKNILHRDIKPENIMLTPREEGLEHVRLIDFGIARVGDSRLAPATQTERGIGTVLYIAPEQLLGKLEQTPAVDIYACAIVAYEMLTGKLPFNPSSPVEMFILQREGVKSTPRELRSEIPYEAENLILQALSFEPSERPQDVRIFGRNLAQILRLNQSQQQDPSNNQNEFLDDSIVTRQRITKLIEPTQPSPLEPTKPAVIDQPKADLVTEKMDFMAEPQEPEKKSLPQSKTPIWYGLALLTLALVSLLLGFVWWKNSGSLVNNGVSNTNTSTNSNNERNSVSPNYELSYYLTVQKMRNGKPFEEPFQASGREIFENGYKFKMILNGNADGYLYIFNEGNDEQGKKSFYLLHPTSAKKDSAQIKADQQVETGYQFFGGGKGTEIIWIIWTKQENEILDKAKKSALNTSGGIVTDKEAEFQLNNLLEQYSEQKNEVKKDPKSQVTIINANTEPLIHRMELEHK